jgi:nucleoside-diphosphate-sugar epimerase
MQILVTGASGRIGRYVVKELVSAGHSVTGADVLSSEAKSSRFLRVDLTNAGEVYQALAAAKADAVVHLGAWANASVVPDTRTYGDNVQGTFNLFQACADLGIQRVVSASSAQVYGFAKAPPIYVPVDEAHPLRPANCYALSKVVGEQAADYFVERFGMTILSFRLMGIRTPTQLDAEMDQLAQEPGGGASLLWTRTDARDAAVACRLAVEVESVPSGPYNITGSRVVLSQPTTALVERYFGDETEVRDALPGHVSPMSCTKAESAFGYQPQYVWSMSQKHLES